MSQKLADGVIKKLREDAQMIDEMCCIYPGDPSGEISADAFVLEQIAELIDEVDWDIIRAHYLANCPKIIISYGGFDEDPTSERSPSGVCSDRDYKH